MAEDKQSNTAGAIWIEDKGDTVTLSIVVGDSKFVGKKNENKRAENHPDYRIFDGDKEIGAAWKGVTAKNRVKLSLRINDTKYTAVMRDNPTGKQPHMDIMPPMGS